MNLQALLGLVSDLPCFDLHMLIQAFPQRREAARLQMSRWIKEGKVIGLRRGVYALAPPYRRGLPAPMVLANEMYRPSYVSGLYALGHYGMIPEQVIWLTSVTSRGPRHFENPLGVFDYRNVKRDAFFGYTTLERSGHAVLIAEPEKALLDHWHLTPGEWTTSRMQAMRYQHANRVAPERLRESAARFSSPRLIRAVERWLSLMAEEQEGTVTL